MGFFAWQTMDNMKVTNTRIQQTTLGESHETNEMEMDEHRPFSLGEITLGYALDSLSTLNVNAGISGGNTHHDYDPRNSFAGGPYGNGFSYTNHASEHNKYLGVNASTDYQRWLNADHTSQLTLSYLFDYNPAHNRTRTAYNDVADVVGLTLSDLYSDSRTWGTSHTGQADLTLDLGKGQTLETGAKFISRRNFARIVSESLEADGVEVACVAGGFPSSQTFLEVKTVETALAVHDGATEIDCVLNVGAFLSGDYETCAVEIEEIKAAASERPLKVILETGALQTAENIKKASLLAMYAGADFIKTSTGKIEPAATLEAAFVMCQAIREYQAESGRQVGFKAAGGIKTVDEAVQFYTVVRELLGEDFIAQGLFRIGTSRLANLLVSDILGEDVKPF